MGKPFDRPIGRFNDLDHYQEFEIAPYGRMDLGQGNDTITLLECEAVAMHLVCDKHDARIDVGATLPFNGHQRYLRNPYSKTVRGKFLQGHPVKFVAPSDPQSAHFSGFHNCYAHRDHYKLPDYQLGLFVMGARCGFKAKVMGNTQQAVSLIPAAKLSYIDLAPASIITEQAECMNGDGTVNEHFLCQNVNYAPEDLPDWIQQANWSKAPIAVSEGITDMVVDVPAGTALLIHTSWANLTMKSTAVVTDLGDWRAEWLGQSLA